MHYCKAGTSLWEKQDKKLVWAGLAPPNLVLHANLYVLADKYGIHGLMDIALKNFRHEAEKYWEHDDFPQAMRVVYTSTLDHDQGIRSVIVSTLRQHENLLDKAEVRDLVEELNLVF